MKSLIIILTFILSFTAFATDCKLDKAISFKGPLLQERYFTNVVTDEMPKFLDPQDYDPSKDTLAFLLFEIENNGSASRLGGVKLGIERKPPVIGFSNSYTGSTDLTGGTEEDPASGVKYYWSRVTMNYNDGQGDAITELKIGVKGNKFVSIEITHPVFEIAGHNGPYTYTQYIGENQKICIKSAKLL